ncbi:MAG: hypothetical protein R8P61_27605 [Bacteroidia bacterium]|nr:hypothetical protein [Bacteroidia bacterium]
MKYLAILTTLIGLAFLTSCGPTPPTEGEVMAHIKGTYCTSGHKLTLGDMTYRNDWTQKSALGSGIYREYCKGAYELVLADNVWTINFNKADKLQTYLNSDCSGSVVAWNPEQGYVLGDPGSVIRDLFNKADLSKGPCN